MLRAVPLPSPLLQDAAALIEPRQAVLLCGGLATRLYPRTRDIPKFLLPVAGKPFAFWLLSRIAAAGYDEVVLCIGHLGDQIRAVVGDGSAFGLPVVYADEGSARLGTAGALRNALDLLAPLFLVTYGDSYLPFDYAEPLVDLAAHPSARGTMSVYKNEGRWDDSNSEVRGDQVVRYEKRRPGQPQDPALDCIDYGAMALRREVIAALPEGALDLAVVQRDLAARGLLRAVVATERFYEIGSEAGYKELEARLAASSEGSG